MGSSSANRVSGINRRKQILDSKVDEIRRSRTQWKQMVSFVPFFENRYLLLFSQ